jgi:hypothetical protein
VAAAKTEEGTYSLLSSNGKVIVFDTPDVARDVLGYLSEGRMCFWDSNREKLRFSPHIIGGVNEVALITNYDPYDAPEGKSESRIHEWRHHVIWSRVFIQ